MTIAMYLIFTLPFVGVFVVALLVLRRRNRKSVEFIDFYGGKSPLLYTQTMSRVKRPKGWTPTLALYGKLPPGMEYAGLVLVVLLILILLGGN